jgi:hypothetical protein
LRFAVGCLLASPCYNCLHKLIIHFMAIHEFAPQLVPDMAKVLACMGKDSSFRISLPVVSRRPHSLSTR